MPYKPDGAISIQKKNIKSNFYHCFSYYNLYIHIFSMYTPIYKKKSYSILYILFKIKLVEINNLNK